MRNGFLLTFREEVLFFKTHKYLSVIFSLKHVFLRSAMLKTVMGISAFVACES